MLGVFIVGALTSNYGGTTVATVIENGDSPIVIQSILDGVLPKLIPLALTLGLFFLMKKKNWKPLPASLCCWSSVWSAHSSASLLKT